MFVFNTYHKTHLSVFDDGGGHAVVAYQSHWEHGHLLSVPDLVEQPQVHRVIVVSEVQHPFRHVLVEPIESSPPVGHSAGEVAALVDEGFWAGYVSERQSGAPGIVYDI